MGYRPGRPSVRLELVKEQVRSCAGCSRYLQCSSDLCTVDCHALCDSTCRPRSWHRVL